MADAQKLSPSWLADYVWYKATVHIKHHYLVPLLGTGDTKMKRALQEQE